MTVKGKVTIIGVLMDLGADRRGVDMGPSAIRVADLNRRLRELGFEVIDAGNIPVRNPEMMSIADTRAKYLHEIATACVILADQVEKSLEANSIPLILGGDHSIAVGSVSGLASFHRRQGDRVRLLRIIQHVGAVGGERQLEK